MELGHNIFGYEISYFTFKNTLFPLAHFIIKRNHKLVKYKVFTHHIITQQNTIYSNINTFPNILFD